MNRIELSIMNKIVKENSEDKSPYIFDKKTISIIVTSVLVVGVVLGGSIAIGMQQTVAKVNGTNEFAIEQNEKLLGFNPVRAPNGMLFKI